MTFAKHRRFLVPAFSAAVAVFGLLAAGCGGASEPRVASIETSPSAISGTATTPAAKMAAFYRCMSAHGLPNWRQPKLLNGSTWGAARIKLTPTEARLVRSPRFQAADSACGPLLPGMGSGLTPAHEAAARAQARRFSQCARSHGMPNFPDPDSIGEIDLSSAGINPESPTFLHAKQSCRSLIRLFVFLVRPAG